MRKHLTANLFKRLSLVALVLSLLGWGVSEFGRFTMWTTNAGITISVGQFGIGYGTFQEWSDDAFGSQWRWTHSRRLHFPPLELEGFLFKPRTPGTLSIWLIPFWLLSLIALAAFLYFRRLDRRIVIAPGCCVHCGYDASKCTDNRCSECGEPLAVEAAAAG